jgi:hypothetical protein
MNDGQELNFELVAFATICSEAAQRHGDDWDAVQRHIRQRIGALPNDQRERLANEMARILRYCAPDRDLHRQ